jgi:hypothetical protein
MWRRARTLWQEGKDVGLVATIKDFWAAQKPSIEQYLALEEFTVLQQIQQWTTGTDKPLSDLARRFLQRNRLAMVDPPPPKDELAPSYTEWETALLELVKGASFDPPEMYCLKDEVKAQYNQPYFPEKEEDEQSIKNAIRIKVEGEDKPIEVSRLLDRLRPSKDDPAGRLKPLTQEPLARVRYFLPKELQAQAVQLRTNWK